MTQPKRRRRRSTAPEIIQEIRRLVLQGWTPAEIDQHLSRDDRFAARAPSRRTIDYIAAEARPRDDSEDWSFAHASADEASLVLPVVAAVVANTAGRVRRVTRQEASWIARIREAVPDVPAWDAYWLARDYITRAAQGQGSHDLDLYLGFGAWREGSRYLLMHHLGWFERAHLRYETDGMAMFNDFLDETARQAGVEVAAIGGEWKGEIDG